MTRNQTVARARTPGRCRASSPIAAKQPKTRSCWPHWGPPLEQPGSSDRTATTNEDRQPEAAGHGQHTSVAPHRPRRWTTGFGMNRQSPPTASPWSLDYQLSKGREQRTRSKNACINFNRKSGHTSLRLTGGQAVTPCLFVVADEDLKSVALPTTVPASPWPARTTVPRLGQVGGPRPGG